jgi:hypothetical protein
MIGGVIVYIALSEKIKITWYQWALGAAAILLLLLTIQNIVGFSKELESVAITFTIMAMGIPAVILGVLAIFLPRFIKTNKNIDRDHSNKAI